MFVSARVDSWPTGMLFLASSCRDRPTSPSTEQAIQGMLSMAGLLCSSEPEKVASPQDMWWSSPSQCLGTEQREAAPHQRLLQGAKSPMDSQGNSSSEAWDNQGPPSPLSGSHATSPETDYQYCDPSMSPALHPSKRHAPNPPPISNQATKGLTISFACPTFFFVWSNLSIWDVCVKAQRCYRSLPLLLL